jgi:zinc resistance-associated protein
MEVPIMKKGIFVSIASIVALTLVTSAALAWGGPGYARGGGYGPGYGYSALPNLTPEQSSKIQALQQEHLKDIAPLQEQLWKKRTEMRELWLSQNPDEAKIAALQKDMLNLSGKLQDKSTVYRLEVRKILTPEQYAQLGVRGAGMGRGMGMMGGRMGRW